MEMPRGEVRDGFGVARTGAGSRRFMLARRRGRLQMKFMLCVLPTVPGTPEDRERPRPIGRNTERYQAMLDELRDIGQLADDAGFDVMTTTEHRFHSEGYETAVAPL